MTEAVKIVIFMDEGTITDVFSAGVELDIVTVDYNPDGDTDVPEGNGVTEPAWIGRQEVTIDGPRVLELHELADAGCLDIDPPASIIIDALSVLERFESASRDGDNGGTFTVCDPDHGEPKSYRFTVEAI